MPELNEKDLKKHIKSEEPYCVYVIYGDEDYLKKHYADRLVSKIVPPDFESFNFEKFEGKNTELRDIFEKAEIMPMMAERRCILVEDYKIDNLSENESSAFESFFADPPQTATIIFLQKNSDFAFKKSKKVQDIVKKIGGLCVLNKRTGSELTKPLIASASKQGCVLSVEMANYLVSVVGDDFNTLINELSKVCNYCGSGDITRKHIDAVAIKTDDAKIYFLTKALASNDFDKAYEVLHSLLRQKTEPEYILGTIISSYVDMYRAKISVTCGEKSDSLAEVFSYGKLAFRLTNAGRDASKLSVQTLRKCLDELAKADMKLKSSRDTPVIVLEQLMVRLFLISNGEKV